MLDVLNRHGFAVLDGIVADIVVDELLRATETQSQQDIHRRDGRVYAMRNLLAIPAVRAVADSDAIRRIVEPVVGGGARAVRGIFFDKTPGANWKVTWHQDLSIAVNRRMDLDGFGPWSVKAGVVHVQPPPRILQAMLTIRLHLDDCGEENGALKVIPGSHARGVLAPRDVETMTRGGDIVTCAAKRGGAVVIRPLILHASSPAKLPSHRRVVHLEFCGLDLPAGLDWAFADRTRESFQ